MAKLGYECEFVGEAPKRSKCPICLLVLREPHQVTCCGKIFCQTCINEIRTRKQSCPACKEENFECYADKGLKQELYSAHVSCSNRQEGCKWQGELRELDNHLNRDPTKEKQLVGCGHTKIKCPYCFRPGKRAIMKDHQDSECPCRPATCDLCKIFMSTYEEVTNQHKPECKCRPVKCPNSCGVGHLQHQDLEGHLSRQCPLSLVECEFSDAGCGAKIQRQDLPSHLRDEVVTHLSLLATENRKLKRQLQEQDKQLQKQDKQLQEQNKQLWKQNEKFKEGLSLVAGVPPLDITYTGQRMSGVFSSEWLSKPFYSCTDGYVLKLKLSYCSAHSAPAYKFDCILMSTLMSPVELHISAELWDDGGKKLLQVIEHTHSSSGQSSGHEVSSAFINDLAIIRIKKVTVT